MKLKVVAGALIAANFTFTSVAHGQAYTPGVGLYGGQVPCGYGNAPASGATSDDDEYGELLNEEKEIKAEMRKLEREMNRGSDSIQSKMDKLKEEMESMFRSPWARMFERHISTGMNCNMCGDDEGRTAPPQPEPRPAPPAPLPPAPQPLPRPAPLPPAPPTSVVTSPVSPLPPAPVDPAPQPRPQPRPRPPTPDEVARKNCDNKAEAYYSRHAKDRQGHDLNWFKKQSTEAKKKLCDSGKMASNDSYDMNRIPASEAGSRMPASDSELRTSRPSSGSDVPDRSSDGDSGGDFDPRMSSSGGDDYHGPAGCYPKDSGPEYRWKAWKKPYGACQDGGRINPNVCMQSGYLRDSQANVTRCQTVLDRYKTLADRYEQSQKRYKRLEDKLQDIQWRKDDLKDGDDDYDSDDKAAMARAKQRKEEKEASGGGRRGPSTVAILASGALSGLTGYLVGSGVQRSERKQYQNYLDAQTALGWQAVPYQSSGNGLQAGLATGTTMFSGLMGAMSGAYGCGGMSSGGIGGGIFGNPYGGNPYAQMGGGMYNGAGPWGQAGPWGYGGGFPGGGGGGFIGGFAGGMGGGYPGMSGGGYPGMSGGGYPGSYAGGFAGGFSGGYPGMSGGGYPGMSGGGYPGSYAGGFAGGLSGFYQGGYGSGGYPGSYAGGFAGAFGGGYSGGYPGGYSGGYGGYGGTYSGGYGGYGGDIRAQGNYAGVQTQMSQIYSQMQFLQGYAGMSQGTYAGGYGGGYGGYSSYSGSPYYGSGVGAGAYFNINSGGAAGVPYYNPYTTGFNSMYLSPTSTMSPATLSVPSRTR